MSDPQTTVVQSQDTALTPEGHESFDVPGDPGLPKCPVCNIGVLYTIAYDPDALHEQGQSQRISDATNHDHYVASGGSIRLKCFNCEMTQTQALNPGKES